jgi:hypothetical protein
MAAAVLVLHGKERRMFTITMGKGVNIKFANGWSISVQWGAWNYCDHHDRGLTSAPVMHAVTLDCGPSKTAEVAVLDPNGTLSSGFPGCSDYDSIRGYVQADEIVGIAFWAMTRTHDARAIPVKSYDYDELDENTGT